MGLPALPTTTMTATTESWLPPPLVSQAPQTFNLAVIDYVIVVVYFIGVLFHGWWVGR